MTFHLPPVVPPAPATFADVGAAAQGETRIDVKGLQIHLIACQKIPGALLRRQLQAAQTPSDIVLEVARLLYLQVSFATRVDYAIDGNDLYLICVPLQVDRVTGTAALQPFFADLRGATAPDASRVVADTVFAELYSQRLGYDSGFKLLPGDNNVVSADLLGVPTGDPTGDVSADFSNAGNRFVGRNIVGASASINDAVAREYRASWKHALGGGGSETAAGAYDEAQASVSGVSRAGIWQLLGHGFRFVQDLPTTRLRGSFVEGSANWTALLHADWSSRSFVQLRGVYASRNSKTDPEDLSVFREDYAYLEPNLSYAKLLDYTTSSVNLDLSSALALGKLLGSTDTTPAARSVQLARASLKIEWNKLHWGGAVLNLSGQFAPRRLPEEMQLVYGGPSLLAGYLPGAVVGDSGALARLGWQGTALEPDIFKLKLRAYVEYGLTRFATSRLTASPADTRGADAGLGLTLTAKRYLTLTVDFAEPFSSSQVNDPSRPGVYFAVSIRN